MENLTWTIIFSVITFGHFYGFFRRSLLVRVIALYAHGIIWCFMIVLAALSGTSAPAVPMYTVLTLTSIVLAARLSREKDNE